MVIAENAYPIRNDELENSLLRDRMRPKFVSTSEKLVENSDFT